MALLAGKTFLAQRQLSGLIIGHEQFALTPCLEFIFPLLRFLRPLHLPQPDKAVSFA